MRMASRLLQRLVIVVTVCLLLHSSVSVEAIHCYDCQHCERIWSTDEWKSVDCGNATCAKRIVSGYVGYIVVPAMSSSSHHFHFISSAIKTYRVVQKVL